MERESLAVPAAFTRYWIDVVLRKPDGRVPPLPEPTTLGFAGFAGFEQAIEVPADARELVVEVVAPAAAGSLAVSDDQRAELHFPLSEGRHYHRVPLGDGTRSVRLEAVRDDRGGPDAAHVTYLHAR